MLRFISGEILSTAYLNPVKPAWKVMRGGPQSEAAPPLRSLQGWDCSKAGPIVFHRPVNPYVHPSHLSPPPSAYPARITHPIRVYGLGYLHYITSSCHQRRPFLTPHRRTL